MKTMSISLFKLTECEGVTWELVVADCQLTDECVKVPNLTAG